MIESIEKYIKSHIKNAVNSNQANDDWVTQSNLEKVSRMNLTDAIQTYFVPFCIEQGSMSSQRYYMNFSKLINANTLIPFSPIDTAVKNVITPKVSIQSLLTIEQLSNRVIATDVLTNLVALIVEEFESPYTPVEYHKAYKIVKNDFELSLDIEHDIKRTLVLPELVADVKQMYADIRGAS